MTKTQLRYYNTKIGAHIRQFRINAPKPALSQRVSPTAGPATAKTRSERRHPRDVQNLIHITPPTTEAQNAVRRHIEQQPLGQQKDGHKEH